MATGVQISEVKGNSRENRTATHSHIKGLGLRPDGMADKNAGGFVGQIAAREVCVFYGRAGHFWSTFRRRRRERDIERELT
jgi:hypothetical protein